MVSNQQVSNQIIQILAFENERSINICLCLMHPTGLCHVLDGALTERHGVISNPDKPAEYYANNE